MKTHKYTPSQNSISLLTLLPYLLITFGITWGIVALYIFLPELSVEIFGELTGNHPLFFLATYSPAVAALTIILPKARCSERQHFLIRVLLWRAPRPWYLFILVGARHKSNRLRK